MNNLEEENIENNEKVGASKNIGRFVFFTILLILFASILIVILSIENDYVDKLSTCGDGTFEGKCSLTKPYYCSNSVLIEDSIACGCPVAEMNNSKIFNKLDGKCVSEYFNSSTEVYYNYILDGKVGKIPFVVHSSVVDYLEDLPRFLYVRTGEVPRRDDFKLLKMDVPLQREAIVPMVVEIQNVASDSKDLQAKIAVSLVQNIPYGEPEFSSFGGAEVRLSRYPYEVLDDYTGSCEGKSELLALLLRELGFGVAFFYFQDENHETVGISCPLEQSYLGSGYCFVETTVPAPISYSEGIYLGINGGKLRSVPEIVPIASGFSLSETLEDYSDADKLDDVLSSIGRNDFVNSFQKKSYESLAEKYGLTYYNF